MKDQYYTEHTLLRLKRKYGKDELVAGLLKQVSELDIESGKLKAEIDHLNAELENTKKEVSQTISEINAKKKMCIDNRAEVLAKKDELYKRCEEKYTARGKEIISLKKTNTRLLCNVKELINKNLMLEKKLANERCEL